jgi:thiol:disulfide interchange protein/DsbC/DsbD-like thiol-disulfide interchange protein
MQVPRILSLAAALLLSNLADDLRAQVYQGRALVKAELIADRSAIVPGKTFTAGLLLRMAPGWHTYWKFSGDAGLPTELKWKLPPGWTAGELQWPIPLKLKDPGDIQTYGYSDEVLLMQEITPPASAGASPVTLTADANWLVCEKLCIPGSASLHLDLPVSATSSVANAELFDRYRRLLPKKWPGFDAAGAKWKRTDNDFHLSVTSKKLASYPVIDFLPLPEPKVILGHPEVESRAGDQINFRIPFESAPGNVSSIDGLVVFGRNADGSDREGWTLSASAGLVAKKSEPEKSGNLLGKLFSLQARGGLLTFLLYGFIGGFILNLMPCVLPVISLKIFGFVQQAGQSRRKIFRSGLAFTAGIFTWFVGLALILIALKSAGHQITWAFQFTNPYFVLFMSVVVLVFALNLFGVFEISLPQGATRGMLGAIASEGDAASFFQGVFATVLATPCTAPFLGTALGFAFTQSPAVILAMFVAIAAGMAWPYLLLCAQPAWLRFLPKPGPWMVRVKQFMGFLLLATLLFLLYVLGAQRGLDALIWASCFLLVVSLACWMKGAFITPVASTRARAITAVLITMLLIASGAYFIGEKFRSSRRDPLQAQATGDWQPFTPERLQAELNQGHVVFVDFTAAWCLTCKFNEASVLESSAVREAFQRHGVTKIKADWTNGDPAITKLLQQFGRPGVPLYVLYPGKSEEPFVFPELLTQSIVLEKLETISRTIASQ